MKKMTAIMVVFILLLSVFPMTVLAENNHEYCIKVKTADLLQASTFGNVEIIICGKNGKTERHNLDDDNNNFQTGGLDEFYITDIDVGEIICIKLTLATNNDNWCCDWIEIDGVMFNLNGYWFSHTSDNDIAYSSDIPRDEPDGRVYETFSPGDQTTVEISVMTDNQSNSGTDGEVFIRLYSSTGISVARELYSDENDFETGEMNTFSFTMMDLQEIEKIDIWMDHFIPKDNWCLSYVKIGDLLFNAKGHWFAAGDGITLNPSSDIFYDIRIDTQDELMSGTDSDIYVKYIGDKGETEWALLDKPDNNDFEKGDSDSYQTLGTDVGTVNSIKLKNDGSDEWRIARVQFQGVTYHMKGTALENSEIEITLDYSGATNVGSVFSTGSLIAVCVGAALLVAAIVIAIILRNKRKATESIK